MNPWSISECAPMNFGIGVWRTRDGNKAIVREHREGDYPLLGEVDGTTRRWTRAGLWRNGKYGAEDQDLVAPWSDSPKYVAIKMEFPKSEVMVFGCDYAADAVSPNLLTLIAHRRKKAA